MPNNTPQPQIGVGAAVFKNGKVLLVRRKNPPAAGMWSIPGGRLQWGETLQQAAEREIKEETGVIIKAGEIAWIFEAIDRDEKSLIRFHYIIIDLHSRYLSGTPKADSDALQARWIGKNDLRIEEVHPRTVEFLKNVYGFDVVCL
ncbi:MAG TPA: NUDIX domain-containing protein [Calditrichaeota bacterium]|nr:NUDIX domain-containing protein [Calditrichota bacterium]